MLNIRKFAAIDIGSNAVRLLVSSIIEEDGEQVIFKKNALVRVPIRLGEDVFTNGSISEYNKSRLIDTMTAFRLLMGAHGVERYKACATSAMREAKNGKELVSLVKDQADVHIDIINGEVEATIIAETDLHKFIDPNKSYLYVDVGGGSTEFSVIHNAKKIISESFKIGTVRLLNDMVSNETWRSAESWIKKQTKNYDKIELIGSGGNINKIFKISGKDLGKPLTYFYLITYYQQLQDYTYEERITRLNLNQDRADVIIPATRIYLSAMKWSNAKHIYVPKIGLSDGIIKSAYYGKVDSFKL